MTAVDGRSRGVLDHMAREIREAGLIQTTKAGWGAAAMTSLDAAHLILGVYGSTGRGTAAAAAEALSGLRVGFMSEIMARMHPDLHPRVLTIQQQPTLAEAVAAVIEIGDELAEQTLRTQSTLPVIGPLYPETLDGRELEDWPQGLSVMLRIAHPTLEPYLLFAWRGSEHVQDHAVAYDWANATPDGKRALASYELHTLVHTNVFRAMHRVLYADR